MFITTQRYPIFLLLFFKNFSLLFLIGGSVFDHRVLLSELQSLPAARYLGGEKTVAVCPHQMHSVTDLTSFNYCHCVIMRLFLFLVHQVLALAAQELSKPITEKFTVGISASTDLTPFQDDKLVHWRQEVQKRIESKTRRLRKVLQGKAGLFVLDISTTRQLKVLYIEYRHNVKAS